MRTGYYSNVFSVLLVSILLVASSAVAQQTDQNSRQTAESQTVTFSSGENGKLHYWLYLPDDYEPGESGASSNNGPSPLMIFLHGRGECGDDLKLVKKWGPPKLVETNDSSFPFVLVSPQCPKPRWDTKALKQLIDTVIARHNVDQDRIYITGLSMGGFATWQLATEHPDFFAAAIPICGGGKRTDAAKLTSLPIWAFHGDADRVIPVAASKTMIEAIKKAGGENAKLTVYPKVGHNSWTQTYANPEIYKWLLEHRRRKSESR